MKKLVTLNTALFSITFLLLISCSQSKFIVAPPFTDVEKISNLEIGKTKDQVNEVLGIVPYDVLYLNDGQYVCYYNYRLLDRKIGIDNSKKNIDKSAGKTLSSEESQTAGVPFYSEWKRIYINFEKGVVKHYTTDAGIEDATYLALVNGTIKLFNKKDLELKNFYIPSAIISPSNVGTTVVNQSLESLDIDKILFSLKNNGKFKSTDSPRRIKK